MKKIDEPDVYERRLDILTKRMESLENLMEMLIEGMKQQEATIEALKDEKRIITVN